MSAFKGTPGPWEPARHGPSGLIYGIRGWHGPESVNVVNWGGISRPASICGQANARLIAAAPGLLEALVMVRDADDDCIADGLETLPGCARAKIDAAIAKAIGEQP